MTFGYLILLFLKKGDNTMQNDSIDNLRLDLNKKSVRGVIYVRVGDTRARTVHITLTSNGKVVDLSDAAICEILIRKPDGSQNDQATINEQAMVQYGNELQYTFRTQDINVPGECHCQVMVTFKDGAVVTSPDFSVMVYEKEVSQEYEQSTNEYSAITQQLIDVIELRNQTAVDAERAETARENIEDIEASCEVAKGQVEELTNRAETAAQSAEASAQSAADDLQATQNYRNEALNYKEATDINKQAVDDKAEEILSYEYQAQQYALSAEASATSASASESSAQTSAASAEGDAISSRSYAKGGTGTRTGEDVDNSKYYYEQARAIAEEIQGALLPQGTITFAQLANVDVVIGHEWNISDDFESDSRFNDGGGVQYAAGTNVYVTADLKFDCMTGSAVTGVKGSAENTYRKGYVTISKEDIGLSNVDNTSDANKPISTAAQTALNAKANTADLATVAFSGSYNDLSDQPTSGGGHVIQNAAGTAVAQEPTMQFTDSHVSDDSTNEKTKVEVIKSVASADYSLETEDGLYLIPDGDGSVIEPASEDYVEVTADGSKNIRTLLNELYAKIDRTKLVENTSWIDFGDSVYALRVITSNTLYFERSFGVLGEMYHDTLLLTSSGSDHIGWVINTTGNARTQYATTEIPTDGKVIPLYYGNKKAVVDLQTTANRCLLNSGQTVESALAIRFMYIPVYNIKTSATITKNVPELTGKTIIFVSSNPLYQNTSALDCTSAYSSSAQQITITKPNASFGGDGAEFKVLVGYLG